MQIRARLPAMHSLILGRCNGRLQAPCGAEAEVIGPVNGVANGEQPIEIPWIPAGGPICPSSGGDGQALEQEVMYQDKGWNLNESAESPGGKNGTGPGIPITRPGE